MNLIHCFHSWDILSCPRTSQDILDLGLGDLTPLGYPGLSQDIPGVSKNKIHLNVASYAQTTEL